MSICQTKKTLSVTSNLTPRPLFPFYLWWPQIKTEKSGLGIRLSDRWVTVHNL